MESFDHGRAFDWGRTSLDYGRHRPGYPPSFYRRITALGIGVPGQQVLDFGTGTGNVARELARRGCKVIGIDISEPQIAEACRLASEQGLDASFLVRSAEATELPDKSFDLITAAQSWHYFDRDKTVAEVKRLLAPSGKLMTCNLLWLPRQDRVAKQTEELVLKHNPYWSSADLSGDAPKHPDWIENDFLVASFFVYREAIPFTHESWRGRIRACRGIGAELSPSEVAAFDAELAEQLRRTVPQHFTVLHSIFAHILTPS